jgi:hypothetical protein
MNEHKRNRGMAPLILIIGTRLEVSGQLHKSATSVSENNFGIR